jgi:hypothetical protein
MRFRLSHAIALMTNAVLVGGLLVLVLSLGWYGWVPIVGAVALGFLLSWPVAWAVARQIKHDDPAWNEARDQPVAAERRRRVLRDGGLSPEEAQAAAKRPSRAG